MWSRDDLVSSTLMCPHSLPSHGARAEPANPLPDETGVAEHLADGQEKALPDTPRPGATILVTLAALAALRLCIVWFAHLDLAPDEAYFWEWARHPDWGYYDQGPTVAWLIRAGVALFGTSELGVRIPALALGALTSWLLARLTLRLGGSQRAALLAVLSYNMTPLGHANALIITYYVPQLLLWTLALGELLTLAQSPPGPERPLPWLRLGAWLGLGALTHHTFAVLALLCAGWVLWLPRTRAALRTPWPWLSAGVMACGGAITLAWNATHDWAMVRHALAIVYHPQPPLETLGLFVAGQFAVLTPWLFGMSLLALGAFLPGLRQPATRLEGLRARLLALGTWPIYAYVALLALRGRAEANWTSAATLMLSVAFGLHFAAAWDRRGRAPRLALGALASAALLTVALHDVGFFWSLGLKPGDPSRDPLHRLHGWTDLGAEVYRMRTHLAEEAPTVTATIDDYAIPAELAFYAPDHALTFVPPIGRRHHQYDFWSLPPLPPGGNAVWVSRYEVRADSREHALFQHWGPAIPFEVREPRTGVVRRVFQLYECRGFTGLPPSTVSGW